MSCASNDFGVGNTLCNYTNACFEKRTNLLVDMKENEKFLRPIPTITKSGRVSKRPCRLDL